MEPIVITPNETLVSVNDVIGTIDDDGTFHPGHPPISDGGE